MGKDKVVAPDEGGATEGKDGEGNDATSEDE